MANSVTFPEGLGGNGQTYTDDADPDTGLDGLGYTVRFIPCLQQAVAMGLSAQSNAEAAADYVQQCQTLRQEVATDRQAVADDRTHVDQQKGLVNTAAGQVATDRQAVADDRTHIDQQKGLVDDAAGQVATDRQAVADDRLASQQAAGASSDAADTSIQARNEAQALYGDLNAVETAKTQAQQAATDAGEERGLAETARTGAETAQGASEQAASTSQQAADTAVSEHVAEEDPHTQYAKKDVLGEAAYRGVVGDGDLFARGGILGTVSESGGMPTGGIIERGSNSDGVYVKFADGTMICNTIVNISSTQLFDNVYISEYDIDDFIWVFPQPFIFSPAGFFGISRTDTGAVWLHPKNRNGTSIRASQLSSRVRSNIPWAVVCYGQWYAS